MYNFVCITRPRREIRKWVLGPDCRITLSLLSRSSVIEIYPVHLLAMMVARSVSGSNNQPRSSSTPWPVIPLVSNTVIFCVASRCRRACCSISSASFLI